MVCHRYSISATVPAPVKPTTHLLQVALNLCYTLAVAVSVGGPAVRVVKGKGVPIKTLGR
jgi:hypothetical protein